MTIKLFSIALAVILGLLATVFIMGKVLRTKNKYIQDLENDNNDLQNDIEKLNQYFKKVNNILNETDSILEKIGGAENNEEVKNILADIIANNNRLSDNE